MPCGPAAFVSCTSRILTAFTGTATVSSLSRFRRTGHGSETFIFAIDYFKDLVVFNILSMIEENGVPEFNVDVVKYNPVSVAKMSSLMVKAGFRAIDVFGDFNKTPIEKSESYDAIFVAKSGH